MSTTPSELRYSLSMSIAELVRPQPLVDAGDGEIIHRFCCKDETLTLCGLEMFDVEPLPQDVAGPHCVLCERFDNEGFCPKYGRCTDITFTPMIGN